MTAIPDGLPSLAQGAHPAGSGRACVMELVSVIAGEEWTDHPKCVHPMLACAAIVVNDQLPDHLRHRLLVPHIGRFFGTNRSELTTPLRRYYAQGNHWFPPIGDDSMIRASYSRVIRDEHCPGCGATLAVKWLSGALDVAEAILDQAPREITTTDVHRVRQVLAR